MNRNSLYSPKKLRVRAILAKGLTLLPSHNASQPRRHTSSPTDSETVITHPRIREKGTVVNFHTITVPILGSSFDKQRKTPVARKYWPTNAPRSRQAKMLGSTTRSPYSRKARLA